MDCNVSITFCSARRVNALFCCLSGRVMAARITASIRLILAIASLSYRTSKYLALAWTSLQNGLNSLLFASYFRNTLVCVSVSEA